MNSADAQSSAPLTTAAEVDETPAIELVDTTDDATTDADTTQLLATESATTNDEQASPAVAPAIVVEPEPEIDLNEPTFYINRELSQIEFNRRVLNESFNGEHPLLERAKFLAIFSNNMDEFFMVRVSGLMQQVLLGITDTPPDGLTPREQVVAIHRAVTELVERQMNHWRDVVRPELADNGIHVLDYKDLKKRQRRRLQKYFETDIFPVLTPLAFDPGHPFPHISNLSLNLAVTLRDPEKEEVHFARVKVPPALPRLVPLRPLDPDELLQPSVQKFVWLEQVIAHHLDSLFPGMEIVAAHPFRVTRNTDMAIQEEEADDLLLTMEENLRQRHFGRPVRLEIDESTPQELLNILLENLQIGYYDVYAVNGPLDLVSLWELHGLERPTLKDPSFQPAVSRQLRSNDDIFTILRRNDVMLHHPYESFSSVVDFINAAATDPDVLAIKMTLYRLGPNPPIVRALIRARENDKQVAVLLELKARFDEESNIEWARALERAGVHVVYGLLGLKTHCKLALVVRRERDGIRRYIHVATGNYNANTARIYTDLGMMTSNEEFGADASDLFNFLTGYSKQQTYRKFLVAPHGLRDRIIEKIDHEATFGSEGHITIKVNALVDGQIIRALYRASQAGVQIHLLVRGICCLRPNIPDVSENIRVTSVIGRFLEHHRIYRFGHGAAADQPLVLVGSADLMPRKLDRRVEVLFPVENEEIRHEVERLLEIFIADTKQAHELNIDGSYTPVRDTVADDETLFSSQAWFLDHRGSELL